MKAVPGLTAGVEAFGYTIAGSIMGSQMSCSRPPLSAIGIEYGFVVGSDPLISCPSFSQTVN